MDLLVPAKGVEPSRLSTSDFKSDSSAYSDTPANINAAICAMVASPRFNKLVAMSIGGGNRIRTNDFQLMRLET